MNSDELKSRIVKYSNMTVSAQPDVLGANPKLFFLVNILKREKRMQIESSIKDMAIWNKTLDDISCCVDLFRTLRSKNNHYITAFNELSDSRNSQPYIPEKIPVLGKAVRNNEDGVYGEVVGSRLSQLMGYDTVYNFAPTFKSDDVYLPLKKCANYEETLRRKTVFSVDFLPYGWEHYTFNDIIGGRGARNNNSLQQYLNMFKIILPLAFRAKFGFELTDDQISKIQREYVAQYLYRIVLCRDGDYFARNAGIMFNADTKDVRLLPNFDMECCFSDMFSSDECRQKEDENIQKTIEFCAENYPDILQEFVSRIRKLNISGKLEKCMKTSLDAHGDMIERKLNILNYQLALIDKYYTHCVNNQASRDNV